MNPIFNTDSYKLSHYLFYPPTAQKIYSYLESRGGKFPKTLFFGVQGLIKEGLFTVPTLEQLEEAKEFSAKHGLPFNEQGWKDLIELGYYPLEIKAVPEGTLVPIKNVLMTVENTDDRFAWLTSYMETAFLRVWYPITVATRIYYMKKNIRKFFDKTSDVGLNPFALLDFSARGCTADQSNMRGGAAYLALFMGSDSILAVDYVNRHYHSDMAGFSVPALEHSITTSWGDESREDTMLEHIFTVLPDNSIVSLVGDTYNIFKFVEKLEIHLPKIREKNLTIVIRPDSGSFSDVLPKVLRSALKIFGYEENSKGYKVLRNCKVLWGDGINEDTCTEPFDIAMWLGISSDSIMVGSGGGLMQSNIDRDTCKFAFKASNVQIDGIDYPIAKNPITDPGKQSKKGRLVLLEDRTFTLSDTVSMDDVDRRNMLRTIWKNGNLLVDESIDIIRERIDQQR